MGFPNFFLFPHFAFNYNIAVAAKTITIANHATDNFALGKAHKEIAMMMTASVEDESVTDQVDRGSEERADRPAIMLPLPARRIYSSMSSVPSKRHCYHL
jgi:hypothetical protein